jgi:hypothetical protein
MAQPSPFSCAILEGRPRESPILSSLHVWILLAETDCLPGVRGLELRYPAASHVSEMLG